MSRVRVIKPKKIIPKPKPLKMGSKIHQGNTRIKDFKAFNDALKKIAGSKTQAGIIKSSTGESAKVDHKISENVGFVKQKDGTIQIITNEKTTSAEKTLIKKIAANYNLIKAKQVLEQKGYKIKEEKIGDSEVLVGTVEVEGVEQSIEVVTVPPRKEDKTEEEVENNIKIHSKNFEDSEKCKEAVEMINKEIEGEIIEDYDTAEYLPKIIKSFGGSPKKKENVVMVKSGSQTKKNTNNQ
ncbi:MAG: hypothetical protein QXG00_06590 [Candidatus Woesearchaeota archaeon]